MHRMIFVHRKLCICAARQLHNNLCALRLELLNALLLSHEEAMSASAIESNYPSIKIGLHEVWQLHVQS